MQKILIIQAVYYKEISKMLLDGAKDRLKNSGYNYDIVNVFGALEIPAAISIANEGSDAYCGFVALGCVIRGETSHYDYVCGQSAYGLNWLAINKQIAIGNGIITVENENQAFVRADINQRNKGGFAVGACLDMIRFKDSFV
jgi:6,7-dimethyl-8-ribityllumazine synthase